MVIGKITSLKLNEITVDAGSRRIFKADLDTAPEIKVHVADYCFARAGDQIELTGYYVGPHNAIANRISITLATPLGDPLSQFGKQKPSKRITNLAGGLQ